MKSIIKNKNKYKYMIKNNKNHYLHFYYCQESIWHNKKSKYRFQGKSHYYYENNYRFYWFNDKEFEL
jgi:hypothetical protein